MNKKTIYKIIKTIMFVLVFGVLATGLASEIAPQYELQAASYGQIFTKDPYIAARIDYGLSLYPAGSYFSKNGGPCYCHGRTNCVASGRDCNCLRWITLDGVTTDLRAVQCMGYAMFWQLILFGQTQWDGGFEYVSGAGAVNGAGVKAWFVKNANLIHPGTHLRVRYSQHSITILNVDYEKGMVTYTNANIDGHCKVSGVITQTWDQVAAYIKTINYAYVYKNYYKYFQGAPDSATIDKLKSTLPTPTPYRGNIVYATPTPAPTACVYPIGVYKVATNGTSNLNLREDTSVETDIIAKLPPGDYYKIFDFAYNMNGHHWAMINTIDLEDNEQSGWAVMDFFELVATITPTPTPTPMLADYEPGNYEVTADSLNVRALCTTNSIIIGKLLAGERLQLDRFVQGYNDMDWAEVILQDDSVGWISMDFVELIPSPTPTPTNTPTPTPTNTPIPTNTPTPTPTDIPVMIDEEADSLILNQENSGLSTKQVILLVIVATAFVGETFCFIRFRNKHRRK